MKALVTSCKKSVAIFDVAEPVLVAGEILVAPIYV